MRRLFAISLIALLAGVGVVALIETDPGYVLVSHGNYTLESSLWVGLLIMGLGLFLFYQLLRLIYRLISGRRSFANWLGSRRSSQAMKLTNEGVVSFTEGNWERARRQLLRGAKNSEAPFVNYLLAAKASDRLEEPERVAELLQFAGDAQGDAAPALEIVRAENRLRAGDYAGALTALEQAGAAGVKTPHVLELQQQAYAGLGESDKLLALVPQMRKNNQLSEEEARQLERDAHRRHLAEAGSASELSRAWQETPSDLKQQPELLRLYIAQQMNTGDHQAAEKSILRALKKRWDPELVRQFGLLEGGNSASRLSQAERWLTDHSDDPQLLLCLGRLCLRENLWGKARDYFESSYRAQPSAEVCAELGRLLIGLGEPKVAAAYYRDGLANSVAALPDLPMPDKVVVNHHTEERSEIQQLS